MEGCKKSKPTRGGPGAHLVRTNRIPVPVHKGEYKMARPETGRAILFHRQPIQVTYLNPAELEARC
ncbi:hypothetical protein DPF_0919 [Desulfoplanes formicivorans]|uniref:Uncharacterized protein n=1 Tax=Desulfoplanes formicivorans TaxID=1592317 RepID=A0A194AGL0_9BACT|nr:hypothetical protein DPF_0919 [Desulfoplanes formicivorans]